LGNAPQDSQQGAKNVPRLLEERASKAKKYCLLAGATGKIGGEVMRRLSDRVEKETASVEAVEGLALMIPAEIVKAPYTPFSVSLPTTSPKDNM
jgi:hypothetical protein